MTNLLNKNWAYGLLMMIPVIAVIIPLALFHVEIEDERNRQAEIARDMKAGYESSVVNLKAANCVLIYQDPSWETWKCDPTTYSIRRY